MGHIVRLTIFAGVLAGLAPPAPAAADAPAAASLPDTIARVQPKMVKIYGAGGLRGLAAYQSGFLISPQGHILTAWSYVLDTDSVTAVLADGRRFEAKLVGADPRLEAAVLKIDATDLPCFDLAQAAAGSPGDRVLAFSNLFGVATGGEPVSVQHGTIAVVPRLEARRGTFETPYNGPVYVLDVVTNNPGAAGGALVSRHGELLGMLGKELRNSLNNTWLNYAIPVERLRDSVEQLRAGKFVARRAEEPAQKPARPMTLEGLGIVLVPDVVERTPPYVDQVLPGSPAANAGIRPDDLVVLLGDRLVRSCKALREELQYVDAEDGTKLTVLRAQTMQEFVLRAGEEKNR
jgi:serine protease Do